MSSRLRPLKRHPQHRAGTWTQVQGAHPGVRDPRSIRISDWPRPVNAAIIASLTLVTAFAILSAWTASPVGEVRNWVRWRDESAVISLEHPEGWTVRNVGDAQHPHILVMRSPWVRIHIVVADELAAAAGVYGGLPDEVSRYRALELLHHSTGETWAAWMGEDELQEGQVGHTVIGENRAVWTQFRYSGRGVERGEPMTGYRATIVGSGSGVIASAVAPTQNWTQFKPIALRLLRSIRLRERLPS